MKNSQESDKNETNESINQEASETNLEAIMESIKASNNNELACTIWGPARKIILKREPNKSLGISIVGGKLDICTKGNKSFGVDEISQTINKEKSTFISGIFIKHVLENSPAGLNGTLHTGDRILAVDGVDLVNGNLILVNTARKKTYDSSYHLRISSPKPAKRLENG